MNLRSLLIACVSALLLCSCYGLPAKKEFQHRDVDHSQFVPPEGQASLVIIRPYNFYYFGHPIDISINGNSAVSLANQSYTVISVNSGQIKIMAQSGTLGPPTRGIEITEKPGETVYLLWKTSVDSLAPLGAFAMPVATVGWEVISKESATTLLEQVERVEPNPTVHADSAPAALRR